MPQQAEGRFPALTTAGTCAAELDDEWVAAWSKAVRRVLAAKSASEHHLTGAPSSASESLTAPSEAGRLASPPSKLASSRSFSAATAASASAAVSPPCSAANPE